MSLFVAQSPTSATVQPACSWRSISSAAFTDIREYLHWCINIDIPCIFGTGEVFYMCPENFTIFSATSPQFKPFYSWTHMVLSPNRISTIRRYWFRTKTIFRYRLYAWRNEPFPRKMRLYRILLRSSGHVVNFRKTLHVLATLHQSALWNTVPISCRYVRLLFSLATLSQTTENQHPRNFLKRRGLVFNRTFAIAIFSECTLKRTGAKKPKICTIFRAKSQTLAS